MTTGLPLLSCCRSIDSLCRADSTLSSASLFSSYAFSANSVQSFGFVRRRRLRFPLPHAQENPCRMPAQP